MFACFSKNRVLRGSSQCFKVKTHLVTVNEKYLKLSMKEKEWWKLELSILTLYKMAAQQHFRDPGTKTQGQKCAYREVIIY